MNRAVFLDRDGVLVADTGLLTDAGEIKVLPCVPEALARLRIAGFKLIVASNQTVVARGLATESDVERLNQHIALMIEGSGGPKLDAFYFCPHHPKATLAQYRMVCPCRKPEPGMLLQAANEHHLDLKRSFMVGDRITDIVAGARAGCRTVLVQTGQHLAPPIETAAPLDVSVKPDFVCADLAAATEWILKSK